jgi:hypothetical protein
VSPCAAQSLDVDLMTSVSEGDHLIADSFRVSASAAATSAASAVVADDAVAFHAASIDATSTSSPTLRFCCQPLP